MQCRSFRSTHPKNHRDRPTPPLKLIKQRFGWGKIDAVKNGRVFNDVNPDVLLRPGPRITQGLEEVYKRLYPEKNN